ISTVPASRWATTARLTTSLPIARAPTASAPSAIDPSASEPRACPARRLRPVADAPVTSAPVARAPTPRSVRTRGRSSPPAAAGSLPLDSLMRRAYFPGRTAGVRAVGPAPRARLGSARSARLRALGPGPRSAASEEVLQGAVVGAGDGERVLVGDRDVLDRVGALVALLRLPLAGPRVALLPVGHAPDGQEVVVVVGEPLPLVVAPAGRAHPPGERERVDVVDLDLGGVLLGEGDLLAAVGVAEPAAHDDAVAPLADVRQVAGEDVVALVAAVAVDVLPARPELRALVAVAVALRRDPQPGQGGAG